MKWLSGEELAQLLADGTHGALVVVPDDIAEDAAGRLESLLRRMGDDFLSMGLFGLQLDGVPGEGVIPVFFMKESEFLAGEEDEHRGLIRVVPLGGGDVVFSDRRGLKGVDALNEELLQHLFHQIWQESQKPRDS